MVSSADASTTVLECRKTVHGDATLDMVNGIRVIRLLVRQQSLVALGALRRKEFPHFTGGTDGLGNTFIVPSLGVCKRQSQLNRFSRDQHQKRFRPT